MTSSPVDRLLALRNEIHDNVTQVHANRTQCECLCERIDRLIEPLERLEHAPSTVLRAETHPTLHRLLQCIDECNRYIEKQKSPPQCGEETSGYLTNGEQFQRLNGQLSEFGQDLCVGLNIQQAFDRQQDQNGQRDSLKEISRRLDQITQKMSDKQSEQQQLFDQMLDRRLQSFRLSLARSQLLQSNSGLHDEHQAFLHIPRKDLHIEEKPLGHGGFADVYKAKWLTHHDQVAVKVIRINHLSTAREDFLREISTMYRVRYDNVLTVLGACIEPSFYAIVVEYMTLGSLYDVLYRKQEHVTFDWSDRYSLAWQMAKSINYLHNCNPVILHRDIKSANFLLTYNGSPSQKYLLKVCDFGLAEVRRETLLQSAAFPASQSVGTFYWKAPELLLPRNRHTKESDVYSLGMVFWELATGRKPWDEYEDETVILIQVKLGERPTLPTTIPGPYQQLIQEAWNQDPQRRPTCFQLMEKIAQEMNRLTISTNQKDTMDHLHSQPIVTADNVCINSVRNEDSTRTSIQAAEEEKSTSTAQDSGILQPSTFEKTITDEDTGQTESEAILESNASASSAGDNAEQSQVFSPSIVRLEPALSQPVDNPTKTLETSHDIQEKDFFSIYKLEKRRPLHRKYPSKEQNN